MWNVVLVFVCLLGDREGRGGGGGGGSFVIFPMLWFCLRVLFNRKYLTESNSFHVLCAVDFKSCLLCGMLMYY